MQLIPNAASNWWKFWSTRFGAIAGVLAAASVAVHQLPLDMQSLLPDWFQQALASMAAFSALILVPIARVVQQSNLTPPDDNVGDQHP